MPDDPPLAAAVDYAARGLPVFPLGRSKRPLANYPDCPKGKPGHDPAAGECLTCHGFYAATTDPARITLIRALHPSKLLAIRTGAASGLLVLDIDPPTSYAGSSAMAEPSARYPLMPPSVSWPGSKR